MTPQELRQAVRRHWLALVLLFPLTAMVVGGLAKGVDAYAEAKRYEEAASGTMAGYEEFTREDMDVLRARKIRHSLAAFLIVPFAVAGLAGCIAQVASTPWAGDCLMRTGMSGVLLGGVQALLLLKQIGNMWLFGPFVSLFGLGLAVFGFRTRRRLAAGAEPRSASR